MAVSNGMKAVRINLRDFTSPQMRAFHVTWLAFFLAVFSWFGIAPLMAIVREDLDLSRAQVGNTIIASVAATIVARLLIGWVAERIGPRRAYAGLLVLGSIPVMSIGLAHSYESFLLFRLAIGVIGASFVLTQYHTSLMFAPNVVGTANATTAGWGNVGGGFTQMLMPLVLTVVLMFGVEEAAGWRVAMVVPGVALFFTGIAYYLLTQDTPEGNFKELRASGRMAPISATRGLFKTAATDHRVWALFVIYAACFGIELTINNIAALYFHDEFGLSIGTAGIVAGLFGAMNLFARSLGGKLGDRFGIQFGLRGRVAFLGAVLMLEGIALMTFSQMSALWLAIPALLVFSLFVQMSSGATFSVVPFVNRAAIGSVAGIVGAGGNAGAVAAGFLFRTDGLETQTFFFILGAIVILIAPITLIVRFSARDEAVQRIAVRSALVARSAAVSSSVDRAPIPAPSGGD
jgi:NNP family nitrate/nitrite transporter-like MFS transporter